MGRTSSASGSSSSGLRISMFSGLDLLAGDNFAVELSGHLAWVERVWISIWSAPVGRCETRFGPGFEIWYGERRANKQQWQALEATVTHALCLRPHCPRPMNRPTGAPPRRSRFSLPLERMWKRRRQGLAFVPAIPIWRVRETWKLSAERGTPQEFEDKYEKLYAFHTTATLNPNRQSMHHRMRTVARNIFTRVHSMSSVSLSTARVSRATQQNA